MIDSKELQRIVNGLIKELSDVDVYAYDDDCDSDKYHDAMIAVHKTIDKIQKLIDMEILPSLLDGTYDKFESLMYEYPSCLTYVDEGVFWTDDKRSRKWTVFKANDGKFYRLEYYEYYGQERTDFEFYPVEAKEVTTVTYERKGD